MLLKKKPISGRDLRKLAASAGIGPVATLKLDQVLQVQE